MSNIEKNENKKAKGNGFFKDVLKSVLIIFRLILISKIMCTKIGAQFIDVRRAGICSGYPVEILANGIKHRYMIWRCYKYL